ncbi:PDDEXK nuclease domain-containing protein [Desulfothermus okinawensis]
MSKTKSKELENALITRITDFLLELGSGFSYVGRQYKLTIDDEDFYIDLLFYHIKLHSYVVIELKTGKFKPEYAGKLNFYLSAVDSILKGKDDNPTIGILICKEKSKTIVEYALRDISKPIGVSEYKLTKHLPDEYKNALPTIEQIEKEIGEIGRENE